MQRHDLKGKLSGKVSTRQQSDEVTVFVTGHDPRTLNEKEFLFKNFKEQDVVLNQHKNFLTLEQSVNNYEDP